MTVQRVSPKEAQQLVHEGYAFVDVRSVQEFESGHPIHAYNVPIMHAGPAGMTPNADFVSVIRANFATDAKIVVACKMGGRSARAAQMLEHAGFTTIADQFAGYSGARDAFGQLTQAGWLAEGLPVSTVADDARDYAALAAIAETTR